MATRGEFDALVQRLLEAADRQDDEKLRRVVELIWDANAEIVRRLEHAGAFEGRFLPQLRNEVNRILEALGRRIGDDVRLSGEDVVRSATQQVAEPMTLLQVHTVFPMIPTATIQTYENFTIEVLSGVESDAKKMITREIGLASVGAKKKEDVIAAIGRGLDGEKSIFTSVEARARTIYETELKRFRGQVRNTRNQQVNERIGGGMEKWWMAARDGRVRASHRMMGSNYSKSRSIPMDQPFIVGSFEAMYPRDWSLPARESVNCRCEAVQKIPDRFFD